MSEAESPVNLQKARLLARERRWRELADLSCDLPEEAVRELPELGYLVADALRRTGDIERARPWAEGAARGARVRGEPRLMLRTTNLLGMLAYESGHLADAQSHFERLLHDATEYRDEEFAARASNNLGVIAGTRGEHELALTAYQRALSSYEQLGYTRGLAQTHHNIGIAYRDLGFPDEADGNFSLAVRYATEAGSDDVTAMAETERALLRAAEGDGALAERLAERALEMTRSQGDPAGQANALRAKAAATRLLRDRDSALAQLDEGLRVLGSVPDLLVRAEIERDRGRLLYDSGDVAAAKLAMQTAIECFETLGAVHEAELTRRTQLDNPLR